jgi:prepilin-type processing-associated H-X9-DG protein
MRALHRPAQQPEGGFTRADLLVVVAVLLLLGLVLTPALARTRITDHAFLCRTNLRQLLNAWRMYAEDNNDRIPSAYGGGMPDAPAPDWIPSGSMSWTGIASVDGQNPNNWDPELGIKRSPLWSYCGNRPEIWRCPSESMYTCIPTNGPLQGQSLPRVRSFSMSGWFNSPSATGFSDPSYTVYRKIGDCLKPGPTMTFVLVHERVDSINDGFFASSMNGYDPKQPGTWRIVDLPTGQHDGACGFAFVDGHAEMKKWVDRRTIPPLGGLLNAPAPNDADVYWLMDHSTRRP